jgi:hypothetical protein
MNPGKAYSLVTTGEKYGAYNNLSILSSETFKKRISVQP